MPSDLQTFTPEQALAVLRAIAPGETLLGVQALAGNGINFNHRIDALDPAGRHRAYVVRRYGIFGAYDRGEKARREHHALQLCTRYAIPAPEPLFLDAEGNLLGAPGIVTRCVDGEQLSLPAYPLDFTDQMTDILARIHALPCDEADRRFLLEADAEALWFLRAGDEPPEYVRRHPQGGRVWRALCQGVHRLIPATPGLVHIDYWNGNILWREGRIAAVIDWEEAAWGDPAIDVAYCQMDLWLSGLPQAAQAFSSAYAQAAGRSPANLGFWQLAAAMRPLYQPQGWISESPARERFDEFVAEALEKLSQ